ncbi:MAG: AIR synthase-related protein, partial [Gammaproteobacteria bacterium SHHR-1]
LLRPERVQAGDQILGLASSGPHSNGYSLIRKIIEVAGLDLNAPFENTSLGQALLAPTRIYVKPLLALLEQLEVHALAHITGGGLPENLPRVLPQGLDAEIDLGSWPRPALFRLLQEQGNVVESEMLRTFNCGIGMLVIVPAEQAQQATALLGQAGEQVYRLGQIIANGGQAPQVRLQGAAN